MSEILECLIFDSTGMVDYMTGNCHQFLSGFNTCLLGLSANGAFDIQDSLDCSFSGSPIRQEYLETALAWINGGKIEDYMAKHQHDKKADELWEYFQGVIAWVRETFTNYRKEMKGVEWGELYNTRFEFYFGFNLILAKLDKASPS